MVALEVSHLAGEEAHGLGELVGTGGPKALLRGA
jgi:hypothetical protein